MRKKNESGESIKSSAAKAPYYCFFQVCREEHQKRYPNQQVTPKEFSKTCAEKWRTLPAKDKKKFEDMAARDKMRYQKEMEGYIFLAGQSTSRKRKRTKDPNAPKRCLSAFFMFCNEKRGGVQKANPNWKVGDVAKELGNMWKACQGSARDPYIQMAMKDKERYEREMASYRSGANDKESAKKSKAVPAEHKQKDDNDQLDEDTE